MTQVQGWFRAMAPAMALALAFVADFPIAAHGQLYRESVLYSFTGSSDGALPFAGVVQDSLGNLYGTTQFGGDLPGCYNVGCGTAFKLDPNGTETVLYAFTGGADGWGPESVLIRDAAGNLYGTTSYGGDLSCWAAYGYTIGCGVVFKLDNTGKETVLHTFTGVDGVAPEAGLILDAAGNLYGTTRYGGDPTCWPGNGGYGCGVVFKLDNTGKETVLHTFTGSDDGGYPSAGAGLIPDAAGNLYGTTSYGGDLSCSPAYGFGCGVVFKLDAAGSETVLHVFTGGADGGIPSAGLIRDAAGNFYGTTTFGGDLSCYQNGCGVVFKLDRTDELTVLHSFVGLDGANPEAGLVRDSVGNLYGITPDGGGQVSSGCSWLVPGCGVVFKLDKSGNETVLHVFGNIGTVHTDGKFPQRGAGLLRDAKGTLYGTTYYGGLRNRE